MLRFLSLLIPLVCKGRAGTRTDLVHHRSGMCVWSQWRVARTLLALRWWMARSAADSHQYLAIHWQGDAITALPQHQGFRGAGNEIPETGNACLSGKRSNTCHLPPAAFSAGSFWQWNLVMFSWYPSVFSLRNPPWLRVSCRGIGRKGIGSVEKARVNKKEVNKIPWMETPRAVISLCLASVRPSPVC